RRRSGGPAAKGFVGQKTQGKAHRKATALPGRLIGEQVVGAADQSHGGVRDAGDAPTVELPHGPRDGFHQVIDGGRGTRANTRCMALSTIRPVKRPPSRWKLPPGGSGSSSLMPAASRARELATPMCRSV